MSQDELNSSDRELEAALKSLTPVGAQIDPIAAAYAAGQRSCSRQTRVWQAAAAALLLISAGAWFVPTARGPASPRGMLGSAVALHDATPARAVTDQSLIMLRAAVAEHGLDGLPRIELPRTEPMWVGETINTRGKP